MPYNQEGVGYQNTDTSKKAADDITSKALTIRDQVLVCVHTSGPISADDVAVAINRPSCSVRPRVTELANDGKIEDSGMRGKTQWGKSCILWRVTGLEQGKLF